MELATKLAEIQALPVGDRIRLVQAIWDSIEVQELPAEPTEAQKQVLSRRMNELDENPDNVLTWEQIEYKRNIQK